MNLTYKGSSNNLYWKGSPRAVAFEAEAIKEKLAKTEWPCFVVQDFRGRIGVMEDIVFRKLHY